MNKKFTDFYMYNKSKDLNIHFKVTIFGGLLI